MDIRSQMRHAKLARQPITLHTEDEMELYGFVEELTEWTIVLRLQDGVVHVPLKEITTITYD